MSMSMSRRRVPYDFSHRAKSLFASERGAGPGEYGDCDPRRRVRRTISSSRWLGFGVRLLFAAGVIAYFVVRYFAFVPRAIQP
jgi:hypothetical protein